MLVADRRPAESRKERTRHGSAKTLSLLTPAPIFVISEERGTISYACGGRLERDVSTERLLTIISASIAVELVCEVGSAYPTKWIAFIPKKVFLYMDRLSWFRTSQ